MNLYRYLTIVFTFSFASTVHGQTATNFMITDSWGNSHRLYEDYLDQGKTVLLKLFYVNCPPCNQIAPHLEPLYQEWGGGEGDVQFIELSILQSDMNAAINVYKNTHQTTYPAAGGEGNSVAASTSYTDGTFGLWTGTPTFIVIAPDRTLTYDVFGFNIQGTIDALDAAITATGAVGLGTAVNDPTQKLSVRLLTNPVEDELILVPGKEINLKIKIVSTTGHEVMRQNFSALKDDRIRLAISSITQGPWICRIEDADTGFVASYLFIKI